MSETKPQYTGGRGPATHQVTRLFRLPVDDLTAWQNYSWRVAAAEAAASLATRGAFAPGDALRVEYATPAVNLPQGWTSVTARVTVEPAAAPAAPPPCGCDMCRLLAQIWDNPLDAEYDAR